MFIKEIGVYVPQWRIKREEIEREIGKRVGKGERIVAGPDEDSITMGYESSSKLDLSNVSAIIFATTTPPYIEKSPSNILINLLDLPENTQGIDIIGGVSSSISAIYLGGIMAEKLGKDVLVILSDKRFGDPFSQYDAFFSHGSASVVMTPSKEKSKGVIKSFTVISEETSDFFRVEGGFSSVVDERFQQEVLKDLIKWKGDGADVVVSAPSFVIKNFLEKVFQVKSYQDVFGMPDIIFNSLHLMKKGKRIRIISFGSGVKMMEVEFFEDYDEPYSNFLNLLERKRYISFGRFLAMKNGIPREELSLSILWRERRQNLRFYGQKCMDCLGSQFPKQNYCISCGGKNLKEEKLPRYGVIFTLTKDYLTHYADVVQPLPMCVVDLDNGARVYLQGTDMGEGAEEFEIGKRVEIVPRILNRSEDGYINYFWKVKVL